MNSNDPLLTSREAAKMFRVDVGTICRWIREGRLKAIKTPGGHNRLRLSEVESKLAESPNWGL